MSTYLIRGQNIHSSVTSELDTSNFPPKNDSNDIKYGDDIGSFTDFVFSPFTINLNSDGDNAPMMKGSFKKLNEKLDSLFKSSKSLPSPN